MTEDKTKIASEHDEHFVALHSGFKLGKYELQAVLGQGGFGITYKAWDGALNRAVAIKEYLPSDVAVRVDGSTVRARSRNDQESFQWGLERFLEEARALARFEATQSIVRVYDYMQDNGTAYMVMALIEGTPLSSVYRREAPLSEERLKAIVLPILDGLDDVHAAGFLHRDIKPANILIRPNGSPVLIDFGAARNALGEKSRSITSVFTPGYAPFEQYTSSGKQGPWTDIYALAATLYYGVTGKAPPQATDRIREDPMLPAVHAGSGRYSPQFLASIDRGLEVFENRRPQSIGQWRDMLTGATTLAVPQTNYTAPPPVQAYGSAPNSQPSRPPTAVPTLNEMGQPSQATYGQGPISQGPLNQGPQSQAPGKSRLPLIAAAAAFILIGGGAAAFFALSPSSERAAEETVQQRAQRLADEAKRAADQARQAQDAAEAEMKKRAEQEAAQKAAEQVRRQQDAELARQAEQARR
ncbi:MAG: serine/threonine protein kinase, partial [Alphaproteobacteria bacterium]|nr:serine/threonine protein kinase [Alphaproteobacteria bacterium]